VLLFFITLPAKRSHAPVAVGSFQVSHPLFLTYLISLYHFGNERLVSVHNERRTIVRIYVASSWKNNIQPEVVHELRKLGHDVYDFKNPS
jgi:hypothetical protein